MAQENNNPTPQQQAPKFACTGNCLNCNPQQRTYCASQHALSNMRVLDKVMETLTGMREEISVMKGTIAELTKKIEAIQNNEADIFDPNQEFVEEPELFPRITEKGDAKDKNDTKEKDEE